MNARLRDNFEHIFEVFLEVAKPAEKGEEPFILQKYPADYENEDVMKSVPKFAFPCDTESQAVDHFTFVLTDLESKLTFGFCRHATGAHTCLCIISCLPWYEIFYKLLNYVAEMLNRSDGTTVVPLLTELYKMKIPTPDENVEIVTQDFKQFTVNFTKASTQSLVSGHQSEEEKFSFSCPNLMRLPSIPASRNLTEYFNAVDANNMMVIFASMLNERRVLIVSKKLSRLTACVHGAASLLYPMTWQHLYIPVLPAHLIDYCSAPMPYIIGLHASLYSKLRESELGDAVVLDADRNHVSTEYNDLELLPSGIVSALKKKLKSNMLGDGVSRTFLKSMVALIGGYRDALKMPEGEQISFDPEAFVESRHPSMKPFLERMLHLQIFEQFINDRLETLNSNPSVDGFNRDEFDIECNQWDDKRNTQSRYKEWSGNMKKQGKRFKKEGKEKWVEFASKANPVFKSAVGAVKDKSKKAYKDIRHKLDDLKKEEESPSSISRQRPATVNHHEILRKERPTRPPPPSAVSYSSNRRISYEKALKRDIVVFGAPERMVDFTVYPSYPRRSRQYKVIDLDMDLSSSDAPRSSKRASSRTSTRMAADDSELSGGLARVSIDLMGDPDIQSIFHKSYSLEDLAHAEEDADQGREIEDAVDAVLTIDKDTVIFDRNANKRETAIMRESKSTSQISAFDDNFEGFGDDFSKAVLPETKKPVPKPRLSLIQDSSSQKSGDVPLISLNANPEKDMEFDPLNLPTTSQINNSNSSSSSSIFDNPASLSQDNLSVMRDNNSPKPSRQVSIKRQAAFYNQKRPQSFRGPSRTSPTPVATDAQTLSEARKAFIQSEVPKPARQSSSTDLDQFDPLLTGQLAVDDAPSSSDANNTKEVAEDDLLKDWNLDFKKKSTVPNVPPRPDNSRLSIGSAAGIASRSMSPANQAMFSTGGYVGGSNSMGIFNPAQQQQQAHSFQTPQKAHSMAFSPAGNSFVRSGGLVSNSPFLQQQHAQGMNRQRSPSPGSVLAPRSTASLGRQSMPNYGHAGATQQSSLPSDPFSDLVNLTGSASRPVNTKTLPSQVQQNPVNANSNNPSSTSSVHFPQPSNPSSKSSWETFD